MQHSRKIRYLEQIFIIVPHITTGRRCRTLPICASEYKFRILRCTMKWNSVLSAYKAFGIFRKGSHWLSSLCYRIILVFSHAITKRDVASLFVFLPNFHTACKSFRIIIRKFFENLHQALGMGTLLNVLLICPICIVDQFIIIHNPAAKMVQHV